jgi:2-hydroxy-6-oxonona-2,4-dienedioate hydrolase
MRLPEGVLSSFVDVRGVRTHYVEAGSGEPLVLVHGAGPGAYGWAGWRQTIPVLARHFHVFAIDTLGFGLTAKPDIVYSDQASVDHLAGFLDALCLDTVNLCGNSRGAYMTAKLAVDHPKRVKRMLMVSSGSLALAMGLERNDKQKDGVRRLAGYDGTPASMRGFMEMIVHEHSKITDDLIADRVAMAALPGHSNVHASQAAFRASLKNDTAEWQRFELTHRLPLLTIPIHMVWGAKDTFAPPEFSAKLQALLPNVTFEMLENSGHQAQNDESDRFNEIALRFFAGAPVAAAV